MVVRAVVKYRGALAHYGVNQENEGIYQAQLIRYDGRPDHAPPVKITLVKGLNHWSGSSEREELVDEIGEIIDNKMKHDTSLPADTQVVKSVTRQDNQSKPGSFTKS
ncbi:MAG TPA: hypothetical protein VGD33_05680 [Chitinophagaceae bacterium]